MPNPPVTAGLGGYLDRGRPAAGRLLVSQLAWSALLRNSSRAARSARLQLGIGRIGIPTARPSSPPCRRACGCRGTVLSAAMSCAVSSALRFSGVSAAKPFFSCAIRAASIAVKRADQFDAALRRGPVDQQAVELGRNLGSERAGRVGLRDDGIGHRAEQRHAARIEKALGPARPAWPAPPAARPWRPAGSASCPSIERRSNPTWSIIRSSPA